MRKKVGRDVVDVIEDTFDIDSKEYLGSDPYTKQIKASFDNSSESLWRASFTVALSGTLGSTALLLISFIKSVYLPITNISVFFMRNALALLSYFLVPAFVLIIFEKGVRWASPITTFFVAILGKLSQKGGRKLTRSIVTYPIPALLFLVYLFLTGGTVSLMDNQSIGRDIIMIIGLMLGTTSALLFLAGQIGRDN